jgi:hypothetical protein
MHKRRTSMTDEIANMLAFYKNVSDRQNAACRPDAVVEPKAATSVITSKKRRTAIAAFLRTRKHRRRDCFGAA